MSKFYKSSQRRQLPTSCGCHSGTSPELYNLVQTVSGHVRKLSIPCCVWAICPNVSLQEREQKWTSASRSKFPKSSQYKPPTSHACHGVTSGNVHNLRLNVSAHARQLCIPHSTSSLCRELSLQECEQKWTSAPKSNFHKSSQRWTRPSSGACHDGTSTEFDNRPHNGSGYGRQLSLPHCTSSIPPDVSLQECEQKWTSAPRSIFHTSNVQVRRSAVETSNFTRIPRPNQYGNSQAAGTHLWAGVSSIQATFHIGNMVSIAPSGV